MKTVTKLILRIILGVFICILVLFGAFLLLMYFASKPTPEYKRNISTTNVTLRAQISVDERNPIVRTYTEEEYSTFDKEKTEKIKDLVDGGVEGDIPCVHLLFDKNIYFKFYDNETLLTLENPPKIQLEVYSAAPEDTEKTRVITGNLLKGEDGGYYYEMDRFRPQYEKYIMEFSQVKISFTANNKNYVSLFAINTSNAPDGTDYFHNETLEIPIPPEK
ncbi:hypothetical protein SAMN02745245_01013 [Anaerosphaera aminiphila DSM 21120]|uniref:Uncharacterized protein n=1 Tax=Anaerosphaera aminiphila DSM 21120 TaxID=1120995 RepID=A0A1M5RVB0_9FIRM|nr:hypothetical protein [Anaerosphaera aminiphila]SHH30257.1 hypothetical protein SAMN02745245_01013 [Anaerosphaera aminiphila DSM 21120]